MRVGREAVTEYELAEAFAVCCLMRLTPRTGRTHQIRVHMKSLGVPILADPLYGRECEIRAGDLLGSGARLQSGAGGDILLSRQALHASGLALRHPATAARLEFEAPLPADMAGMLEALRAAGR